MPLARTAIFSPDGHRLAVIGHMAGGLQVVELEKGEKLFAVPRGYALAFSPDGLSIAVAEMCTSQNEGSATPGPLRPR